MSRRERRPATICASPPGACATLSRPPRVQQSMCSLRQGTQRAMRRVAESEPRFRRLPRAARWNAGCSGLERLIATSTGRGSVASMNRRTTTQGLRPSLPLFAGKRTRCPQHPHRLDAAPAPNASLSARWSATSRKRMPPPRPRVHSRNLPGIRRTDSPKRPVSPPGKPRTRRTQQPLPRMPHVPRTRTRIADRAGDQTVRTTLPTFWCSSTYRVAATTSSSG